MPGINIEDMFATIPFISWPAERTKLNQHIENPTNVLWFSSQLEFPKMAQNAVIRRQPGFANLLDTGYERWLSMVKDLYKPNTPLAVVRRKYKFWMCRADEELKKNYTNLSSKIFYFDKPKQGLGPATLEPLLKIFFDKHKPFIVNEHFSRSYIARRWDRSTQTLAEK